MSQPLRFENAFSLLDTYGLSLEITMLKCHENNLAVDLTQFTKDALQAGWSQRKIDATVQEALARIRRKHCNFYLQETA